MNRPISVVISSLRPARLERTIDSIEPDSDFVEVVVAAPVPPKPRRFVRHVPVPPPGDPGEMTFTQKNNLAVRHAGGEFVVFDNDDLHFRPGWARVVLQHMERRSSRPYLANFLLVNRHGIVNPWTAFGLLYANHGCIRKDDLALIGGSLFDERYAMYWSDVDLGVRVWSQGGTVATCEGVLLDEEQEDTVPVTAGSRFSKEGVRPARSYRELWMERDAATFFDTWFKRYFGVFARRYPALAPKLHSQVLEERGLSLGEACRRFPRLFLWGLAPSRSDRYSADKARLALSVNLLWRTPDYEIPYDPAELRRGGPRPPDPVEFLPAALRMIRKSVRSKRPKGHRDVTLLVNGYRESLYNILCCGEEYFGIHQQDGPFDIEKVENDLYEWPIIRGRSVEDVSRKIDRATSTGAGKVHPRGRDPR